MMSNTEHEDILELLPGYALNSLDADEAALVGRHLPACEQCQDELAAYEKVVDVLPLAAPDSSPAPDLKDRLMAQVDSEAAPEAAAPLAQPEPRPGWGQQMSEALQNLLSGPKWRPVAWSAAVLIVIALVAGNVLQWRQANTPDPNSWRRIRLTASEIAPEAQGIIYISADGRNGTIIVDQLPQLGPDQQYQLWLIQDGQRTSGAVFSVDQDGYRGLQIDSPRPLQEYGAFGITIEPAGGSPSPTGERVLGYNL
jgi:anti-sigma-K factor RskA